jgi:hypothetical protein
LSRAKQDRRRNQLTEHDEQAVYDGTRAILKELDEAGKDSTSAKLTGEPQKPKSLGPDTTERILGFPADGKADEVALLAFERILDAGRYKTAVAPAGTLAAEMVAMVEEKKPQLVCIGAIAPGGLTHARYLCKRLRTRCPEVKILVGRWCSDGNLDRARATLTSAGADRIAGTLTEARDQVSGLMQLEPPDDQPPAGSAERAGTRPLT